jgi:hypothetical protein
MLNNPFAFQARLGAYSSLLAAIIAVVGCVLLIRWREEDKKKMNMFARTTGTPLTTPKTPPPAPNDVTVLLFFTDHQIELKLKENSLLQVSVFNG